MMLSFSPSAPSPRQRYRTTRSPSPDRTKLNSVAGRLRDWEDVLRDEFL